MTVNLHAVAKSPNVLCCRRVQWEMRGEGMVGPAIVRHPGEGDPPMTPEQIRDLALTLYTIIFESHDVAEPRLVRDRCIRTCQKKGLEPTVAAMISEALTSYVYGWSNRSAPLITPISKAQAVLHLTMGGPADAVMHTRPANAWLTPDAIAAMVGWVLTAGMVTRP